MKKAKQQNEEECFAPFAFMFFALFEQKQFFQCTFLPFASAFYSFLDAVWRQPKNKCRVKQLNPSRPRIAPFIL